MAQRRMISKSISTSVKLAEVSTFAKLLFTWIIPHCDDFGRMDGSARLVKGIVVPLCDETVDQVEAALKELEKISLVDRYEIEGREYLEVYKWNEHQTLRSDRPLRAVYPGNPLTSKKHPEVAISQRKRKLSEVKGREEKRGLTHSIEYLSKIPLEDIKEFTTRFVATEKEVKSKAEDLRLYCERKGRKYSNYRSFLLNALKRDFKERDGKGGKYDHLR